MKEMFNFTALMAFCLEILEHLLKVALSHFTLCSIDKRISKDKKKKSSGKKKSNKKRHKE